MCIRLTQYTDICAPFRRQSRKVRSVFPGDVAFHRAVKIRPAEQTTSGGTFQWEDLDQEARLAVGGLVLGIDDGEVIRVVTDNARPPQSPVRDVTRHVEVLTGNDAAVCRLATLEAPLWKTAGSIKLRFLPI